MNWLVTEPSTICHQGSDVLVGGFSLHIDRPQRNCDLMTAQRRIYKISPPDMWREARTRGAFLGSPDDIRDGYIHMSTAEQVAGTLDRHFSRVDELIIAAVNPEALGDTLIWEAARNGALFPHIYAALPMTAVVAEYTVVRGADGRHALPSEIAASS
jgi:uncharacterized protein (DUF952 family)